MTRHETYGRVEVLRPLKSQPGWVAVRLLDPQEELPLAMLEVAVMERELKEVAK